VSGTATAVLLSSSTPQQPLSSINNLLRKSVELIPTAETNEFEAEQSDEFDQDTSDGDGTEKTCKMIGATISAMGVPL
jgi:hypothetical protein